MFILSSKLKYFFFSWFSCIPTPHFWGFLYLKRNMYSVTALCHSTDQQQQEQLIEKYMVLPNQVWDDIINQVGKWLRLVSCVGLRGVLVFQIL
jgi:hypothetical protein